MCMRVYGHIVGVYALPMGRRSIHLFALDLRGLAQLHNHQDPGRCHDHAHASALNHGNRVLETSIYHTQLQYAVVRCIVLHYEPGAQLELQAPTEDMLT